MPLRAGPHPTEPGSSLHHVLSHSHEPTHDNQGKAVGALVVWSASLACNSSQNQSQQGEQQGSPSKPGFAGQLQLLGCYQPSGALQLCSKAVRVLKSSQQHAQLVLADAEGKLQVCKLAWSMNGGVNLTTVSHLPYTTSSMPGKVLQLTVAGCCIVLITRLS